MLLFFDTHSLQDILSKFFYFRRKEFYVSSRTLLESSIMKSCKERKYIYIVSRSIKKLHVLWWRWKRSCIEMEKWGNQFSLPVDKSQKNRATHYMVHFRIELLYQRLLGHAVLPRVGIESVEIELVTFIFSFLYI